MDSTAPDTTDVQPDGHSQAASKSPGEQAGGPGLFLRGHGADRLQAGAAGAGNRGVLQAAARARAVWLGLIAAGVGLLGTVLLARPETRTQAELLLACAGLLAVWAWGAQPWRAAFSGPLSTQPAIAWDRRRALRLAGSALCLLVIWLANNAFLADPVATFGAAGWLWLVAIVLLVASTAGWPRREDNKHAQMASAQEARSSSHPASLGRELEINTSWPLWEIGLFAGIVVLALTLRLWDLVDVPFAIHQDEVNTGLTAMPYLHPGGPPVFSTLWEGIDLPALWFVLVAGSLKLFGTTLVGLRVPAALFGAAMVLPFYGMVRGVWGRAAALGGTTILAFSASDLQYSRITINNIVAPFFWTACFFFLLRGLKGRRPLDWALAGLMGGLSEHFYYGTRLLWVVLAVFAVYLLAIHWRQAYSYLGNLGLLAIGYLVGFGPLLSYFLVLHPELYFGRALGPGVLVWDHIPTSLQDLKSMWDTLWPLMADNLLGVSTIPGRDGVYFAPLLLPAEATLLALGVVVLVWRWREPAAFLMLLAGAGVLFAGGTLIHGTPYIAHWTPAFPAFYAAIAVPIGLWAASGSVLPGYLRPVIYAGLGVVLLVFGWLNVDFYFRIYRVSDPMAEVRTVQMRAQAALGTGYRVRDVGSSSEGYSADNNSFLIAGQDGANLYNPASQLPLPGVPGKGLAFYAFTDNAHYLPILHSLYPGGEEGELRGTGAPLLYRTYILSPEQANAIHGAYLQQFDPGGRFLRSEKVARIGSLPPSTAYPVLARWSAALYIPEIGSYAFLLSEVPSTEVLIAVDEQEMSPGVAQRLLPGWHRIDVRAELLHSATPAFLITQAGAQPGEVSTENLWAVPPGQGLLGAVAGQAGRSIPRIDPFIGFNNAGTSRDWTGSPVPGPADGAQLPLQARWVGELNAPASGMYSLEIDTDGKASLMVDGKRVFSACPGLQVPPASLRIDQGWHRLQIDYIAEPGASDLELFWTPPMGTRDLVPVQALRYAPETSLDLANPPIPPDGVQCP